MPMEVDNKEKKRKMTAAVGEGGTLITSRKIPPVGAGEILTIPPGVERGTLITSRKIPPVAEGGTLTIPPVGEGGTLTIPPMGEGGTLTTSRKIPPVDIYFLFEDSDGEKWYSINKSSYSSSHVSSRRHISLDPSLPPRPGPVDGPAFASLGSIIYSAGGADPHPRRTPASPSNKVFYIDTLRPEDGWKEAPPMNTKRMYASLLADDGRIYAFGGLNMRLPPDPHPDGKRLFAEVYDPKSNAWYELARLGDDELNSLPLSINGHAVVDHGNFDRKILFHDYFNKNLFYLHTKLHNDVGIYDEKFGAHHPSSAFLDGILYFIFGRRIYSYDISSGRKMPVVLRDARPKTLPICDCDGSMPGSYLLSLGNGYLALIWAKDERSTLVHSSILEMSKVGNTLEGKVLNCTTYSVQTALLLSYMAVVSIAFKLYGSVSITPYW